MLGACCSTPIRVACYHVKQLDIWKILTNPEKKVESQKQFMYMYTLDILFCMCVSSVCGVSFNNILMFSVMFHVFTIKYTR